MRSARDGREPADEAGAPGRRFQAAMPARDRRQVGAHYTGERDAMKLIRGLFLDELEAGLGRAREAGEAGLRGFLKGLRAVRLFDPACGCGDFLLLAYRALLRLEALALAALGASDAEERVGLGQVFGIEIAGEAVEIAAAELLRVDAAFGRAAGSGPTLIVGDALELEWSRLLAPGDEVIVLGNPPFVGKHYQTARQKAQMRAIFAETGNAGDLDYVACWFVLAARYLQGTRGRCGFVATNSVTQGEQVPLLWRALARYAVKIHFAYRSFRWTSAVRGAARVHVVIVGFGAFDRGGKRLYAAAEDDAEPVGVVVENISPYLTEGADRWVVKANGALTPGVPVMRCGSKASDGGALVFSDAERAEFLKGEPGAEGLFRRYCGSEELLNGGMRWCLWLRGVDEAVIRSLPRVAERVARVRAFRAASTAAPTRAAAERAAEFFHVARPPGDYVAVPEVSSERRRYIPVAILPGAVIASNKLYVVAAADMFVLGVLASAMHMAWVRVIGGRLKSDYQYSATMVYNTFPWPVEAEDGARAEVEAAARGVLAARAGWPGRSLAALYDPRAMPGALARAHAELDAAVDRCFCARGFAGDEDRFAHALARHHALVRRVGLLR